MEIRQRQEKWEHAYLAPSAAFSDQTRGRRVPIDPCPFARPTSATGPDHPLQGVSPAEI